MFPFPHKARTGQAFIHQEDHDHRMQFEETTQATLMYELMVGVSGRYALIQQNIQVLVPEAHAYNDSLDIEVGALYIR